MKKKCKHEFSDLTTLSEATYQTDGEYKYVVNHFICKCGEKLSLKYSRRKQEIDICNDLINKFEKRTGINLKEINRCRGFDKPSYNRSVFYVYMNKVMGFHGTSISSSLNIDRATGNYYGSVMSKVLIEYHHVEYLEAIRLINDLCKQRANTKIKLKH